MNMMNLRSYSPPPRPSPREQLDELVRSGYRPYICGDPGYGIVIAWATSVYVEVELSGQPGFKPERWTGQTIPTRGLVPDMEASVQRVAEALGCDNVKLSSIDASLEFLLSSSIKLLVDDYGNLLVTPIIDPITAKIV
jgi:hypothetical protein